MIEYLNKDITTVEKGVILHGCNTSGTAFGSGVAGAIRKKWPDVYEAYVENGGGKDLLGTTEFLLRNDRIGLVIANGYTQLNYGGDGQQYADVNSVRSCVKAAVEYADAFEMDVYMPLIGCGLGGLSWLLDVKPLVEKVSLEFPGVNINICTFKP